MHDSDSPTQAGIPTMIGCPLCAGALALHEEGHGHVQLRCSVGHTLSPCDAYQAKEEELEKAQWSVIVLLKHLQMLTAIMREHDDLEHSLRPALTEREIQIGQHIQRYERLIHDTKPAQSSPPHAEPQADA